MVNVELADWPDESVTVPGLKLKRGPWSEEAADSPTFPEKPLRDVSVIVRLAEEPRPIFRREREADSEKPGDPTAVTMTETVTEWVREPLTPVTWTVKLPVELEASSVSSDEAEPPADKSTLVALNDAERPAGETVSVKLTVPAKPPTLARLTIAEPELPEVRVKLEGASNI